LPKFESELRFLPPWLSFLTRIQLIKTLNTFAVQYWYYAQLEAIGQTGEAEENLGVGAAALRVMRQQSAWVKARARLKA
jgi:hypothetical protein